MKRRNAICHFRVIQTVQYTLFLVFYVIAMQQVKGDSFVFAYLANFNYVLIAVVAVPWVFFRMRRIVYRLDQSKQYTTNYKLMKANLVLMTLSFIVRSVSVYLEQQYYAIKSNEPVRRCEHWVTLQAFWATDWIFYISRFFISIYMVIKFSKSKQASDLEFLIIFARSEDEVLTSFEQDVEDERIRTRDRKRAKILILETDMEVKRIITSFFQDTGSSSPNTNVAS